MATTRIIERVSDPFSGARVDEESGVIAGASICGLTSKNGNDYARESFGDGRQYEGRHVYLNHEAGRRERRAEDKIGWFETVRFREYGTPEGDFHVLKSHPMAAAVLEAARRNPGLFGFSHVAQCRTTRGRDGRQKVEAVESVESIDLVSTPATTKGLFEGAGAVELTLSQLVESQEARVSGDLRKSLRRWLVEMDGDPMMDAPVDAPADGTDHGAVVDGAITSVMTAAVQAYIAGDIDEAELGKRIKTAAKAHPKLKGEKKDDAPAEEAPAEDKAESVARSEYDRVVRENIDLSARAAGVVLDDVKRGILARSTEDERKGLLESWRPAWPAAPERPTSGGRRMSAAELLGKTVSEGTGSKPDAKAFAASIRN